MALRTTGNKHVVSTSAPVDVSIGDEWFDPSSNRLYKFMVTTANASPTWNELYTSISGAGITFPNWTTAGRPLNPTNGTTGYNTSLTVLEMYVSGTWVVLVSGVPTSINYLIVGGGGGGGSGSVFSASGGGGAGGLLSGTVSPSPYQTYTVTVGGGGALANAGTSTSVVGMSISLTALGGAAGANTPTSGGNGVGGNGGSGGGSAGWNSNSTIVGGVGTYPGSAYVSSARQGYDGGGYTGPGTQFASGGGGGAGGPGGQGNAITVVGGSGGIGVISSLISPTTAQSLGVGQYITATNAVYFGGGGGGAANDPATVAGGYGGGGAGSVSIDTVQATGLPNTGGGGGGGTNGHVFGQGGSGVVIFRYPANYTEARSITTSGVTVLIENGYRFYVFKSSGTITF